MSFLKKHNSKKKRRVTQFMKTKNVEESKIMYHQVCKTCSQKYEKTVFYKPKFV